MAVGVQSTRPDGTTGPGVVLYCLIAGVTTEYLLWNQATVGTGTTLLTDAPPGVVTKSRFSTRRHLQRWPTRWGLPATTAMFITKATVTKIPQRNMGCSRPVHRAAGVQYEIAVLSNMLAICQGGTSWMALQVAGAPYP